MLHLYLRYVQQEVSNIYHGDGKESARIVYEGRERFHRKVDIYLGLKDVAIKVELRRIGVE